MPKIPLMIDTDTAGDDCLALLMALLDPAANLVGITVSAGNLAFERQIQNALLTVNAAGRLGQVPVHAGLNEPLEREWTSSEEVHGDGIGGLTADLGEHRVSEIPAVDALLAASHEYEGDLVIVCIAPLTTIASAILRDPAFVGRVKRFYVMGGSNNGRGNVTASAEYNFYVDPEAAAILFASGAAITVVPWAPLTLADAVFDRRQRAAISKIGTPLADFFARVTADSLLFEEAVGIGGSTHPDSLTAAIALHPRLIKQRAEYNVQIETSSELTRGHSAMSWGIHSLDPNATVVEHVSPENFFLYVQKILKRPVSPTVPFAAISPRRGAGKRGVAVVTAATPAARSVKKTRAASDRSGAASVTTVPTAKAVPGRTPPPAKAAKAAKAAKTAKATPTRLQASTPPVTKVPAKVPPATKARATPRPDEPKK